MSAYDPPGAGAGGGRNSGTAEVIATLLLSDVLRMGISLFEANFVDVCELFVASPTFSIKAATSCSYGKIFRFVV